jgi:hypothetical protein
MKTPHCRPEKTAEGAGLVVKDPEEGCWVLERSTTGLEHALVLVLVGLHLAPRPASAAALLQRAPAHTLRANLTNQHRFLQVQSRHPATRRPAHQPL